MQKHFSRVNFFLRRNPNFCIPSQSKVKGPKKADAFLGILHLHWVYLIYTSLLLSSA